jgi:hypothetical protein
MLKTSQRHWGQGEQKDLVLFVNSAHAFLAFRLGYDLSRIFHNDLVWFERSVTANTVAAVCSLNHLNSNIILAPSLGSLFELFKVSIAAFRAKPTDAVVTLIEHVAILAILVTAGLWYASTLGQLLFLGRSPNAASFADKDV